MRRICCVNLCESGTGVAAGGAATAAAAGGAATAADAAAFVLADFQDAYAAYERMSSSADDAAAFEFVTKAKKADTVVVAYKDADAACEYITGLSAQTKVYGISFGDVMPSQAIAGLDSACKRNDCLWQGTMIVTKEPVVVTALQKKPRMGWWRRKLSEATDRLIACVRAGISIQEAPDLFGASKKQRSQASRNLILVS